MPSARSLHRRLLTWYDRVGRDLPWRRTRDPYAIAVSEVMLQQTQVDRVIPKYLAWMKAFPNVEALAHAPLSDILKLWSGLGYNNRALRLRAAAQIVVRDHGGKFPRQREVLKSLPGFGPYTSGAVAAFAFHQPESMVDTNIRRVVTRVMFGAKRKPSESELAAAAEQLLSRSRPAAWNHALMDLGALVCVARTPRCAACPLQAVCQAYPAILTATHTKPVKPVIAFKDSDRYVRGQVMQILMQRLRVSHVALRKNLHTRGITSISKIKRAISGLEKDGLVVTSRHAVRVAK